VELPSVVCTKVVLRSLDLLYVVSTVVIRKFKGRTSWTHVFASLPLAFEALTTEQPMPAPRLDDGFLMVRMCLRESVGGLSEWEQSGSESFNVPQLKAMDGDDQIRGAC
jgi:hypothetical protein